MKNLIKNICYRIKNDKSYLIVYLILMPIFIFFAIYFTNSISYQLQVGVIGNHEITIDNHHVNIMNIDEVPKTSEFLLNKYDVVIQFEDGSYKILSAKGEAFEHQMQAVLEGREIETEEQNTRGAATNIVGFLLMVVGLLGVQLYMFYYEERSGINKRIMSTSITYKKYLLSHFVVNFFFLLIPAVIMILSAIFLFNIEILITIPQLVGVLSLLIFFATAFGLWINAITDSADNAMMYGNMFAIIGSIVCGGFAPITNNVIFNNVIQFLPQRQIMLLLENLENGLAVNILGIIYVIVISIILIIFAIRIEKRMISKR